MRMQRENSKLPSTCQFASPEETACANESDLDLQEIRIGIVMRFWDLKDTILVGCYYEEKTGRGQTAQGKLDAAHVWLHLGFAAA
jgi:hypothetical protein